MEDTQLTYYGGYYEPLKQLEQEVLGWLNERVDELDGKHQERPAAVSRRQRGCRRIMSGRKSI